MNTQSSYSFVTKSDEIFFPGLEALLNSIRKMYQEKEIIVLDCGLNAKQKEFCKDLKCKVVNVDVSDYKLEDDNYSKAIFAFIELEKHHVSCETLIFLDADVLILNEIDELANKALEFNFSAVFDYPPIDFNFQISDAGAYDFINEILPGIDFNKNTFNAGVFAVKKDYYFKNILPVVKKLLPIHSKLYGKDQILLNLAAQYCNKKLPYYIMDFNYNSRPNYTRAPQIKPLILEGEEGSLKLIGIAGEINILHFVRYPKPWQNGYDKNCPSYIIWNYFYKLKFNYESNKL